MTGWHADRQRELVIRALPVAPYIGLTLAAAEARAASEGRHIRVLESLDGPRHLDLRPARLNVELDSEGRVTGADAG